MRISEYISFLEETAPLHTQDKWDNSGYQIGNPEERLTGVLLSLDANPAVALEAAQKGANLIICHHPLFFGGVSFLHSAYGPGKTAKILLGNNITLYASHTPLDACEGGTTHTLCRLLGINVTEKPDAYTRMGVFPAPMGGQSLIKLCAQLFRPAHLRCAFARDSHETVAVCAGAGKDSLPALLARRPHCFITGEVNYHTAQSLLDAGISLVELGHYESEAPAMEALFTHLQNRADLLEYNVPLFLTETDTRPGAAAHRGGTTWNQS